MSREHDRLSELADEIGRDVRPLLPGARLWERGQRRQRHRRSATVAAAVLVAAVIAVGAALAPRLPHDQRPAAPTVGRHAGLPSHVVAPAPSLPGTAAAGPLGKLALVSSAERRTGDGVSPDALFGVSAATGVERFLDLPDRSTGGVALSRDGGYLAYWTSGHGARTTRTVEDGVAIYDASTGRTRTFPIVTDYGLDSGTLTWSNSDRVVIQYHQVQAPEPGDDSNLTRVGALAPTLVWRVEDAAPAPYAALDHRGTFEASFEDTLLGWAAHDFVTADVDSGQVLDRFPGVSSYIESAQLSPYFNEIALMHNGGTPITVLTPGATTTVPLVRADQVLGWITNRYLLVLAGSPTSDQQVMEAVDVDTGATEVISRVDADLGGEIVVAAEYLEVPLHFEAPPTERRHGERG